MSQVIRIPSNIYSRLEQLSEGFDTPANVIERLLNHYEGIDPSTQSTPSVLTSPTRDRTKYAYNKKSYGKGRLVLAVVQKYVADNPSISYEGLLRAFPKQLQGSIGVVNRHSDVEETYRHKKHKRHFMKTDDLIHLSDCDVTVCTEWGAGNIDSFIQAAQSLGYTIYPIAD